MIVKYMFAGIGGFMPRSRSRGSWQMRGGRCVTNSSRPALSAGGTVETTGGDQGMFVIDLVHSVQYTS